MSWYTVCACCEASSASRRPMAPITAGLGKDWRSCFQTGQMEFRILDRIEVAALTCGRSLNWPEEGECPGLSQLGHIAPWRTDVRAKDDSRGGRTPTPMARRDRLGAEQPRRAEALAQLLSLRERRENKAKSLAPAVRLATAALAQLPCLFILAIPPIAGPRCG